MTGFDNGPKDGDFVRYIDGLSAARAAVPQQPDRSRPAGAPSPFAPQSAGRQSPVPAVSGPARAVPTPPAPRPSAAEAAAIATGLLRADGTVGPRAWGSIAAMLIGMVLLIAGVFAATFNAVFFAIGGALLYWTVGRWVKRARVGAGRR